MRLQINLNASGCRHLYPYSPGACISTAVYCRIAAKMSETPKFWGPHRRFGRPFGELSRFHAVVSSIIVIAVLVLIVTVLILMKPAQ